jgi:hypothetical protein
MLDMKTRRQGAWRGAGPALLLMLLTCTALLAACSGSDDDDRTGQVRVLNATADVGSLSLFAEDERVIADVPPDSLSRYITLKAEENLEMQLKRSGNDAAVLTTSHNLEADVPQTLVAWGREGLLRLSLIEDDIEEPAANVAKLRVFNAATDAGPVDVYIGNENTDFDSVSAASSSVGVGSFSGFSEIGAGTIRVRITTAGSRHEWRLDVPALVVGGRQVITLVLQPTSGGVLVHALMLVQQGPVTAQKNTQSRLRLVASIAGNGAVAASVGDTVLASNAISPNIGRYVLVPARTRTLLVQVGGQTVAAETMNFAAGQDYTLLVYGHTGSAAINRVSDDNRAAAAGRAKVRLVHGVEGHDALSLTVDSVSVANDLALGAIDDFSSVGANLGNATLEVTSPLQASPLYTTTRPSSSTTGVSLESTGVYTVFMLSGNAAPRGFLRRDR